MPTLRDIARAAGVAPATASRALSGHRAVADATRAAVQAAALRLGWQPDPLLGALARRRWGQTRQQHAVAVLLQDRWTSRNQAKTVAAVTHAGALGWRLEPRLTWDARQVADGVIIDCHEPCTPDLPWERLAVVNVGEGGLDGPCHRVGSDWRDACDLVRAHLPPRVRVGGVVYPFAGSGLRRALHAELLLLAAERGRWGLPPLLHDGSNDGACLCTWVQRHRPQVVVCADNDTPGRLRLLGIPCLRIGARPGVDLRLPERLCAAVDLLHSLLLRCERGRPTHPLQVLVPGMWRP